jgi:hypothetical protein
MAINERVLDYSVSTLRNDIVDYHRVIRLTLQDGETIYIGFPPSPPADWLHFAGAGATNVYLPAADFDATYRVLLEESPVYASAFTLFGIRAFTLSSGQVAPGQHAADAAELREFMARVDAEGPHGATP